MKVGDLVVNNRGETGVIVDDKFHSHSSEPSVLVSFFGEWEGQVFASHLNDLSAIKGEKEEDESR